MRHTFTCDNCGKQVETYCFSKKDDIVHYYTPPINYNSIASIKDRLLAGVASYLTSLCKDCIEQ